MTLWTDDRGLTHAAETYENVQLSVANPSDTERGLVIKCAPKSMLIHFDQKRISEGLPTCIACAAAP